MSFAGKTDVTDQLDHAIRDANEKLLSLHNLERQSVRTALVEERSRLCLFVSGLKPVMVSVIFQLYSERDLFISCSFYSCTGDKFLD